MVGMDVGGEERAVCERFVEVGAMLDARRDAGVTRVRGRSKRLSELVGVRLRDRWRFEGQKRG